MDPSKLLRARNDGKVEWNTTRCILPVAYRRICNGNPGLWLAVFFKAWDKKQYNTLQYNTLQNHTVKYNTDTTVKYSSEHYSTIQYSSMQHKTYILLDGWPTNMAGHFYELGEPKYNSTSKNTQPYWLVNRLIRCLLYDCFLLTLIKSLFFFIHTKIARFCLIS